MPQGTGDCIAEAQGEALCDTVGDTVVDLLSVGAPEALAVAEPEPELRAAPCSARCSCTGEHVQKDGVSNEKKEDVFF